MCVEGEGRQGLTLFEFMNIETSIHVELACKLTF
jgi:hypothetical protein